MRRLWTGFLGLMLVGALVGCHHTAGVCDCGYDGGHGAIADVHAVPVGPDGAMMPPPEAIQVMPRGEKINAPTETAPGK